MTAVHCNLGRPCEQWQPYLRGAPSTTASPRLRKPWGGWYSQLRTHLDYIHTTALHPYTVLFNTGPGQLKSALSVLQNESTI